MWKWTVGILGTVLAGTVTWWLTEGAREAFVARHQPALTPPAAAAEPPATTPAPGPGPTAAATPVQPPAPPGIGACAAGAKPDNGFHDAAAANGSWDWNCDGQVERESKTCESLTRAQCDPNTNATHTPGGFCAQIRGPTGCMPTVAACGSSGWVYPCFYNPADGRCHAGGYETAAIMRCR